VTVRILHRIVGVVMILPFLAWAVSGFIFFVKPGYSGAYETLAVRTYPIELPLTLPPSPAWLEVRYLRTVIGDHLIVRTDAGWQHLDPKTLHPKATPGEQKLRELVQDAFASNPSRYGHVVSVDGMTLTTNTGVRVTLGWTRLTLAQRGKDTDRIDSIYKLHYLQWTGIPVVDKIVGGAGLVLILVLSGLGVRLLFRR